MEGKAVEKRDSPSYRILYARCIERGTQLRHQQQ